jgi:hypothetical protein
MFESEPSGQRHEQSPVLIDAAVNDWSPIT